MMLGQTEKNKKRVQLNCFTLLLSNVCMLTHWGGMMLKCISTGALHLLLATQPAKDMNSTIQEQLLVTSSFLSKSLSKGRGLVGFQTGLQNSSSCWVVYDFQDLSSLSSMHLAAVGKTDQFQTLEINSSASSEGASFPTATSG